MEAFLVRIALVAFLSLAYQLSLVNHWAGKHSRIALVLKSYFVGVPKIQLQYRPATTAHTRVIFCVVPLVFIARVKSKSMHGLGPRPLVVPSVATSMIMRE